MYFEWYCIVIFSSNQFHSIFEIENQFVTGQKFFIIFFVEIFVLISPFWSLRFCLWWNFWRLSILYLSSWLLTYSNISRDKYHFFSPLSLLRPHSSPSLSLPLSFSLTHSSSLSLYFSLSFSHIFYSLSSNFVSLLLFTFLLYPFPLLFLSFIFFQFFYFSLFFSHFFELSLF